MKLSSADILDTVNTYYKSKPLIQKWFERKSYNVLKHVDIIYNMSQHPTLAKYFCATISDGGETFIGLDSAMMYIKQNNTPGQLLIKFVELSTYGVYKPHELSNFINHMVLNVGLINEDNDKYTQITLNCNINQLIFEDQQQKLVFKYKDKNTLDELARFIKLKLGYDIQIMEVDNKYEITVQDVKNNHQETNVLYDTITQHADKDIAEHIRKKRSMVTMPNCIDVRILTIENTTKPLSADDINRISKIAPMNVVINNIVNNYNNCGNVTNNIVNNTVSPIEQRRNDTSKWISSNPPNHMEKTTDYYNRYKTANANHCSNSEFGKLMKHEIYQVKKSGNSRYWLTQ
jgi:hypothetical protein